MGALLKHSLRSIRNGCDVCGIVYQAGDESTYLYLAHDTSTQHGEYCADCDSSGPLVLMNPDGTQHMCRMPESLKKLKPRVSQAKSKTGEPKPKAKPAPAPKPSTPVDTPSVAAEPVAPVTAPETPGGTESELSALLRRLLGTPQIDRAQVETIAREVAKEVTEGLVFPERLIVVRDNVRREIAGRAHPSLETLIKVVSSGQHSLMVGPAGTGKSTLAEQTAEALGLPFYAMSLSPQTSETRIVGFYNAMGDYVSTLFRQAFEHGGIFHFDEFDNGHPSILALINAALANGTMAFPDGMVKRHPDFRCVASANTYGRGATRAYVGRQAIDAATMDRFAVLTIDIDESLEEWLCVNALGADDEPDAVAEQVLRVVRKVRRNVETLGLSIVISPRASVGMCELINAGLSWEDAIDMRLRRGMPSDQWSKVNA